MKTGGDSLTLQVLSTLVSLDAKGYLMCLDEMRGIWDRTQNLGRASTNFKINQLIFKKFDFSVKQCRAQILHTREQISIGSYKYTCTSAILVHKHAYKCKSPHTCVTLIVVIECRWNGSRVAAGCRGWSELIRPATQTEGIQQGFVPLLQHSCPGQEVKLGEMKWRMRDKVRRLVEWRRAGWNWERSEGMEQEAGEVNVTGGMRNWEADEERKYRCNWPKKRWKLRRGKW